uniref:Uncharacterized protein n=1 Tax=Oryzias latipes TaxID=8090 RepID=A0A3P9KU65_ORYLA
QEPAGRHQEPSGRAKWRPSARTNLCFPFSSNCDTHDSRRPRLLLTSPSNERCTLPKTPSNERCIYSNTPSNGRGVFSNTPSNGRCVFSKAPSNDRCVFSNTPSNERCVFSKAPSNERCAFSKSNERCTLPKTPSNERCIYSNTPSNGRCVFSNTPKPSKSPNLIKLPKLISLQIIEAFIVPNVKMTKGKKSRKRNDRVWPVSLNMNQNRTKQSQTKWQFTPTALEQQQNILMKVTQRLRMVPTKAHQKLMT